MGRKNGDIIEYLTQFIGGFVIAFMQSWKLTLVLLAAIPAIIVATAVMASLSGRAQKKGVLAYAAAGSKAQESLTAIRTVHALRLQDRVKEGYENLLKQAEKMGYSKVRDNAGGVALMAVVVYSTFGLGFFYGSRLVAANVGCAMNDASCMTGGKVLSTFFAVIMGAMGLGSAFPCITSVLQGKAAAATIFHVINRVPSIDSISSEGIKLQDGSAKGEIEISNVTFAYPTRLETPVLKDYTLKIKAGCSYAFVGPSGQGKSTLMSLLLRFYDPQKGCITLDGHDIRNINVRSLRRQIGMASQEPLIFATTIAENIKSGKEGATEEDMIHAAKQANCHDFIQSFPMGYETFCGEGGTQLSGGQKQRIAIARALIKNPSILLLDEATSALDNQSERIVQETLDNLQSSQRRTTLIIAHRLTTIQRADHICYVKEGKVVECGSHHELMHLQGHYAKLVASHQDTEHANEGRKVADAATLETGNERDAQESNKINTTTTSRNNNLLLQRRRSTFLKTLTSVEDIEVQDEEGGESKPIKASKLLWDLAIQEWGVFSVGVLGSMVNGAGFPALGYLIARAQTMLYYDNPQRVREGGEFWGLMFLLLGLAIALARFAQEYGLGIMTERLARKLRTLAFAAMIRKEISWFDREENSVGALTTQLSVDAAKANSLLGSSLGQLLQLFFCLVIALALAFGGSWQMATLVLATLPLQIVGRIISQAQMRGEQSQGSKDQGSKAGGVLSAAVLGIRTVAAFSLESVLHLKYQSLYHETLRVRIKEATLAAIALGYTQTIQHGSNALLFYVAGLLIKKGSVDFAGVMQSIMVLMLGTSGLAMAMKSLGDSRAASEGTNRISQLLWGSQHQSIDAESHQGEKLREFTGEVEFQGIHFAYPSRPDQCIYGGPTNPEGFSLKIRPHETTALVGPSGSGKSTCIQLLLRFYDVDKGKVLLDGHNIKRLNVNWIRSQIAYLSQEPTLFQGTIRENILFGKPDATQEEIIEACKAAQIHETIISWPQGYDTTIDEGSINISGGQKQRLCLARAFIGRPMLLCLDEATSALDNENEARVQEALENMHKIRPVTTLIIAHRLSTIENADRIVVMTPGGKVVETGKHQELLKLDGVYAQLVKAAEHNGENKI